MKPVPLSRDDVLALLSYDPETGVFTRKTIPDDHFADVGTSRMYNARFAGEIAGYECPKGYRLCTLSGGTHRLHRLAFLVMTGEWPPEEIDHINGDPGDNRWNNLRAVTTAVNSRNQHLQVNNRTGLPGVHWDATYNRWIVQIGTDVGRLQFIDHDFFEECCLRKSLELQHNYTPRHGRYRRENLEIT